MANQEIFIVFIISARFLPNHDSHRFPNFYWRSTTYNEQVLPKKCVSNAILKKRSSFENVKWEYHKQYVIFTENSDFTLSNDPRLISNFVITKVQLSTLVGPIYPRRIIWGLFKKNGGPSKQIWPTKKFSLFSLFLPDFCQIMIPTDFQISTEEVQLIMSRFYPSPRNVFQFKCHLKKTEFIWKCQMRVSQRVIYADRV